MLTLGRRILKRFSPVERTSSGISSKSAYGRSPSASKHLTLRREILAPHPPLHPPAQQSSAQAKSPPCEEESFRKLPRARRSRVLCDDRPPRRTPLHRFTIESENSQSKPSRNLENLKSYYFSCSLELFCVTAKYGRSYDAMTKTQAKMKSIDQFDKHEFK